MTFNPLSLVSNIIVLSTPFCFSLSWSKILTIRAWEIQLPSARLFFAQLVIAALDWMLASLVLFVLLAWAR